MSRSARRWPLVVAALAVVAGGLFVYQQRFYGAGYPSTLPASPQQPIAFSHRQHATELEIDCLYCHHRAEKAPLAGLPSVKKCRQCHVAQESGGFEAAAAPIAQAWEQQSPIEWVRVYDLPDHVYFSHRMHLAAQVDCRDCHGNVEEMDQVRRTRSLSMGWCIECHRDRQASVECSICHL